MKKQTGKLRIRVIGAAMLLALCACGGGGGSGDSGTPSETPTDPTPGGSGTPTPPTTPTTSGVFPHTANPMAVAVTEADSALASFDVGSSADPTVQTPSGASDIAAADGVTVTFGFPGDTFLESQSLALTSVTLAALDDTHPLPFQSVVGAFKLAPSDSSIPELRARNLVRVTFTLTQAALDALGGQPVIFSANADGTQVHLVPVVANGDGTWTALTLTTAVDHLGLFGIATLSDVQAATLADAWPSYDDYQLEAAMAPPSYQLRKSALSSSGSPLATRVRATSARVRAADATSGTTDWLAQQLAMLDAYYNDVVAPAMAAANAPDADIAQFQAATLAIYQWERARQLLDVSSALDNTLMQFVRDLVPRGLEKAKADCSKNRNGAALSQLLGMLRQMALLEIETDSTAIEWALQTCGRSTYDVRIDWRQVNTADYAYSYAESLNMTQRVTKRITSTGKMHVTGSIPEISEATIEGFMTSDTVCGVGAPFSCITEKAVTSINDAAPTTPGTFYGGYRIDRWNMDARGHYATPHLDISFQNPYNNSTSFSINSAPLSDGTTRYDAAGNVTSKTPGWISDYVNAVTWNGGANIGTTQRIIRRSEAVAGQYIASGVAEYWTTTLSITATEQVPSN